MRCLSLAWAWACWPMGLVLGLALIESIAFPSSRWLTVTSAVAILIFWVGVPWLLSRLPGARQ